MDGSEVSFPWARGVVADGAAADVSCSGCVTGGTAQAMGDLALQTVTSANLANEAVA